MTRCFLAGISLFAFACSGPLRVVRPRPCPPGAFDKERVPLALAVPHPEGVFIPPMPISTQIHGSRMFVRAVIDTTGRVMSDSITVCGVADPMYAQRIAEEVAQMRFRPGLMFAKHVVAPSLIAYEF